MIARAEGLNDRPPEPPGLIATVEIQGAAVEIVEQGASRLPTDRSVYGVPRSTALEAGDPRPTVVPPDVRLARCGHVFVANAEDGAPLCSWHACAWRLPSAVSSHDEAPAAATRRHASVDERGGGVLAAAGAPGEGGAVLDRRGQTGRDVLVQRALNLPPLTA